MSVSNNFSQRLKSLRLAKGLQQSDIARALGVTQAQVSDMERGRRATTADKLVILADCLDVSIDYLLNGPETHERGEVINADLPDNFKEFIDVMTWATSHGELLWKHFHPNFPSPNIAHYNTKYKGRDIYIIEYSNMSGVPHYVIELEIHLDDDVHKPAMPMYQDELAELLLQVRRQNPEQLETFINAFIHDYGAH